MGASWSIGLGTVVVDVSIVEHSTTGWLRGQLTVGYHRPMAGKPKSSNGSVPATGSATRWLDHDEQAAWLAFVFGTRLFWEEVERDLQRDAHLPFGYYEILVMLSEAPERTMRMSDLADATQSSRSRLSHAVARLERDGWIRREDCPTDRRGANAVL